MIQNEADDVIGMLTMKLGITAKNQRKLAKAIKRARAMGLMSSTGKVTSIGSYFGA